MTMPTFAPSRRTFIAASGVSVFLAGCSGVIGPGAAPNLYLLHPQFAALDDAPPVTWALTVSMPAAVDSIDTQRIALTRPPVAMDYFANAAWTDRVPVLVQGLIVEALEKSGRIQSVARESEGLNADYVMQADVRDFEAQYDQPNGPPTVLIRIEAKLLKFPERTIVANIDAVQRAPASANNMDAIVQAFNVAAAATFEQIARWALSAPSAASQAVQPAPPTHGRRRRRHR
ncbi:MAG TPA: ABC-type transport auxiliary lipoprotein family protein [Rhizomicrobium sp.]|nr:ABC-type transport auxiliary lipoprotein family protein [Rhizomicrobium sp.]